MAIHVDRLSVEHLRLDTLRLDPRNPRKHSERQIGQIARSIENFGFNVPILIDRKNKVLAGHGRALAAQKLELREVPTIRLDRLTEAQARAFMVADNRLSETSVWDDRLLAEALKDLSELQLDFSIEATGFTVGEIDLRIESLTESTPGDEKADALPSAGTQDPTTEAGDLWFLGHNRVYCGNAVDARAFETLMQGEKAAMVFTDPPFNVRIDGHASGLGAVRHREFAMASGEMTEAQFTAFLTLGCNLLARNSRNGSIHFVCTDWRHTGELIAAGKSVYSELKNI